MVKCFYVSLSLFLKKEPLNIMFETQNNTLRILWLVLSVILAVVALFCAVYWAPIHNNSTGLFWAIFALMAVQSYSLYKEGKNS
ncbi:hypothetical protein EML15_04315 [Corynebacterium sp. sy017]|nr:hypothetical protein [Corynebacterium sp. sy017]TSD91687.1 hypothetical protein ELY17_04315 [Corynebacterium sp. SY003]